MQAKQFNKIAAWRKRWISRDQVIRTNWISSVLKEILIKLGSFFQLLLRNHRAYKIIWKLSRILLSLILPRFSLMLTPSLWFLYFDQKCYKIRFRWFRWSVIFFIFFPQTCSLFLKTLNVLKCDQKFFNVFLIIIACSSLICFKTHVLSTFHNINRKTCFRGSSQTTSESFSDS